jgi:phosphoribosylformylglycinamidine synthase
MRNASLRFICRDVFIRPENRTSPFTSSLGSDAVLRIPIAHGEGNFVADKDVLDRLEDEDRIAFRYCDASGAVTPEANPNGSARNIAGILNERGNVLGMMPHPERCAEQILGSVDGAGIFASVLEAAGIPA